ncbi:MAG: hypothetical protein AB7U21_01770 [Methanomethylovorans sp.]
MFDKRDWVLILVPRRTRDNIRWLARQNKKKMWQVVDDAVNTYD